MRGEIEKSIWIDAPRERVWTETGFSRLPAEVAARTYPQNEKGWRIPLGNIKAHVEAHVEG
jgi:uncharacterized protein YndB with AHSA1/START domain